MTLPLQSEPETLCLLRLSAVGDISHMLPIVRTIQKFWPNTRISWVIGKLEYSLVADIPDIEFIIFDKSKGLAAYRELYKRFKNIRFDVLLHMQMSLRASMASLLIPARLKLGFDRHSAKDWQWLFTSHKVTASSQQHVIDSFFNFIETLGIHQRTMVWDIPISNKIRQHVDDLLPKNKKILLISPCSSMAYRNWLIDRYAAVADYAYSHYDFAIVLSGGSSTLETQYGNNICNIANAPILNLIGKTNLKQLCAVLDASSLLLSPDSGPAHLATAFGLPVIGLYACTNPKRAQPYFSGEYVINRYEDAVMGKYSKPSNQLPWGMRIRDTGTMQRISINEVCQMLDKFMQNNPTLT